ncbi:MAG: hypothetical protein RIR00_1588 [Pseudomonadota bacterium]
MTTAAPDPMPIAWVERIFETFRLTYGASWERQWSTTSGADSAAWAEQLAQHWSRGLAGFQANPKALKRVMESLPAKPPNLPEFRALLQAQPRQDETPLLTVSNTPMPSRVAEELRKLREPNGDTDPKAWARRLLARAEAGERLSSIQVRFAREALGILPTAQS